MIVNPCQRQAQRIFLLQFMTALLLAAAGWLFSTIIALSLLIGAAACTLGNAVFAFWVFRAYDAGAPGVLTLRIYGAEIAKILMVLGVFVVAFATIQGIYPAALFGAYFITQVFPVLLASELGADKTH